VGPRTLTLPDVSLAALPLLPYQAKVHHPLASQATGSSTDTIAPLHFTVFLILGCAFTHSSYIPASFSVLSVPSVVSVAFSASSTVNTFVRLA